MSTTASSVSAPRPSPLARIEAAALERATKRQIDVRTAEGAAELRALVTDEALAYGNDSGAAAHDDATQRLVERALRDLAGYGPLEPLLADPDVWEIVVNGADAIFVRRHSQPSTPHSELFLDADHLERTLVRLLDDAGGLGARRYDPTMGLQDATLADGSRIHIVHGDVAAERQPLVNIRKRTGLAVRSLEQLVACGSLSAHSAAVLAAVVAAGATCVIAGAPGSGKTTVLGCLAAALDPEMRVVVAEEVTELSIPLPNVATMHTRTARPDRGAVELRDLVAGFLRMAPDVAIVGEVRDREALALLLTLSSGITGFTTIHAASAVRALGRLRFLAQLADTRSELPMAALNALIADSIDVVVYCERIAGRPQVSEIIAVENQLTGPESPALTTTPVFLRECGRLVWTKRVPERLANRCTRRRDIDLARILTHQSGLDR